MLCIVSIVACLAEGSQILRFAVLGRVVEVCNSEHNLHCLTRFLIHKVGVVFLSAELTAVVSTFKNGCPYFFPILWVSVFVFWFYWHCLFLFWFASSFVVEDDGKLL